MFKILLSFICSFGFLGCAKHYEPLSTVDKVDIKKYLGTWYEIARFDHSFERGCTNVSATYDLKDNGNINVFNQCTKEDGTHKKATGIAYAVDITNTKLKVSFFRPFYGNYWVLMLDEEYTYALIGEPSREYLWILSRTKSIDEVTKNKILEKAKELKFDTNKFIWVKHNKK
ncbi:MAG: lipocalin family protein [Sulfurospirillaceae bacterium]|nr:lipocalin family protein [Sulfurospirillaceae bacterium]MDD3462843.1 lipocalin family protein [Sulfurospirillaceae bacterium]